MGSASHIDWTRSLRGRNPSRVLIAGSLVACSYIDDQGKPGAPGPERLVCLDLNGKERWSVPDFRLDVALRDGRLVGVTQSGEFRVVDLDGRDADGLRDGRKKVARKDVREVRKTSDGLLVRTGADVFVVDAALEVVDRFPAPLTDANVVVVDAAVVYVDHKRVMSVDRRGRKSVVCDVPTDMAHDAMDRWERDTGTAALDGIWVATNASKRLAPDSEEGKGRLLGIGDRLPIAAWQLHYDGVAGTLFLVNHIQPHVVIALEPDGRARWCTYLSPGCCGGSPTRLPNGELVVSSGCGGIVSWLDATGRVLRRSERRGLLSRNVRALSDSSCVVDGGSCLAYRADGTLRWEWGCDCSDYDEQRDVLVLANWNSKTENSTISLACIRNPDGASHQG